MSFKVCSEFHNIKPFTKIYAACELIVEHANIFKSINSKNILEIIKCLFNLSQ